MIEQIKITDREQWLALRKQDVTASVAGALLGVHPYVSPYALYLLKQGLTEDPEETPAMRRGRLLEPVAVQILREDHSAWALDQYPVSLYYRDPAARIGATPDVLARDALGHLGVVQIKTVAASIFARQWKNGGEIEPPLWIAVQAIIEAYLTGAQWAAVAALVVDYGINLHLINIPIHREVLATVKDAVQQFWGWVDRKEAPSPDYGQDGALIARMHPKDDGTTIDLSGDNRIPGLVEDLASVKASIKKLTADKETMENEIKAKLGAHTFGAIGGGRLISWKVQHRSEYTVAANSFRVLRVPAGGKS